jgi:hypothetical protein
VSFSPYEVEAERRQLQRRADAPGSYETKNRPAAGWGPDEDVNDAFARRLAAETNAPEAAPRHNYNEMSPAAKRALVRFDEAPPPKERFIHETDIGNVESIRKTGIRPSRGGSAMGHEGVYAYPGEAKGRTIPAGRALIEFEADPRLVTRNTVPGNRTVAIQGGRIAPEDVKGGFTSAGRLFDLAGGVMTAGSLANTISGMLGGPSIMSPLDNAAQYMMEDMYRNTGLDQVYAPGQEYTDIEPVYHRLGRGRGRRSPTTYEQRTRTSAPGTLLG